MMEPETTQNFQIEMPIKEKGEFVYGIKRNISKSILYAGILPQWRNFLYVFSTLCGIALTITLALFIYLNLSKLPNEIPLIFQQNDKSWANIPKDLLYLIPGIVFLYTVLMNFLKGRIYSFDKRLVLVLNVAEIVSYIFTFVGLSQIFSLVLV